MYALYTTQPMPLLQNNETLTPAVFTKVDDFLFATCQYRLVHTQPEFANYPSIIIVEYADGGSVIACCECIVNTSKNMVEVYNVCVDAKYRNKGHASGLKDVFETLKSSLDCTLWIAVARINPMFGKVIRLYKNMGFRDHGIKFTTPSGIEYKNGFAELMW